jgi:hypothetical protein
MCRRGALSLGLASFALLSPACGPEPPAEEAPTSEAAAPAPPLPNWVASQTVPLLAAAAAERWRLVALPHAPAHFRPVAWKDSLTIWGVAGCNPVELRVDVPEFAAWNVEACGGIAPHPDDRRLAWSDGRGGIWWGVRGQRPAPLLAPGSPSPAGEGDASGLMRWSPDGTRLLTSWSVEWNAHYATLSLAGGEPEPVSTSLEGYYLVDAWDWLDADRVLFSAQATRDARGRSEYSEAGGVRADLAVLHLSEPSFSRVTTVSDSVLLKPLGRWADGEVLVGERARSAQLFERYWAYDPRDWSRRAVPLPAGADVLVFDATRVLVLERSAAYGGVAVRAYLWNQGDDTEPLVELRDGALAWSPDGRRVALSTSVDEPVAGAPGSFRTYTQAYVLEPR